MKKIIFLLVTFFLFSCRGDLHDKYVRDADGNYYKLHGVILGSADYRFEKVDTNKVEIKGFKCNE